MLARAKTGTGKTLAFLIPSIERLVRREKRRALLPLSLFLITACVKPPLLHGEPPLLQT